MNLLQYLILKRKHRKELELQHKYLKDKKDSAWRICDNMIHHISQCKIIESESAKETEQLYKEFINSFKGKNLLGSLWEMKEPEFLTSRSKFVIIIRYRSNELFEGITLQEYEDAYKEYLQHENKYNNFFKIHYQF